MLTVQGACAVTSPANAAKHNKPSANIAISPRDAWIAVSR
jgi:hypothetical protein